MDFSSITVLCIGDIMLDRFVYGEMERISPEAPVPVLRLGRTREMPGGVGNVANNILSLGGRAILVGLVGRDTPGQALRGLLGQRPGLTDALVETGARPTICKTRFIAANQQVVRADEESRLALQPDEATSLIAAIDAHIGAADIVVLSDYAKGTCADPVIAHAIATARARGIAVFVDPKSRDFARYRGASCITPNARELAQATGLPIDTDAEIEQAARAAMARADAVAILATRSEKGMALVEREGGVQIVPARAREVFDVSGAGDTVIAALALAAGSGMTLAQAMHVANAAAGVVVGKLGTATADIAEVLAELNAQDADAMGGTPSLLSRAQAAEQVARWKAQGLRVGFTNGCFDIIHPGHVALLAAARRACDRLIVALNDDASVARLKGPERPVNPLEDRARVMAAIRHVDAVVAFGEDTPLELIRLLLPDVLVKGADYRPDQVVGADVVRQAGGRVVLADLEDGKSTTRTIGRIRAAGAADR
ncbi:rfaE bifunctional protein [Gluconacetobacter diazotrophicus PA1 5]|uniref:Bifunctional protein HldE n=1 Tax=Gluconacetobacter diazotrophicus (strain ATCC 49037 / DSM 5601 / CCUG 37298 / CIP 103539 / LMG 7603 / PAl5) TaxID=272568 RepID=HLDE_GLUDA|nr:D-glycero-beta-D-manno-heptose-7-phosphate kinase [Gluconacetobacter diazotrophicus]A9HDB1.1 RecName: Full=Bifunctional protein HldE; Includes: RecName: Full=D-beta-D-heptose 7-phosphate kinase; AltName: Full=D-beta-D-heptose 7-phosphotransferase; AltName: Full=D-glycero-beta-D-manno-heptose-7-phosphate kinase; Includes: RecName: Full=D-beta-D-heptose 1-phosphate adenylyltransferase; AltName: Full=D-glycero-beta-D-manno-heptose 1-phosphate adenylyltransferase [Gluconacetobacter diazotrophicus P